MHYTALINCFVKMYYAKLTLPISADHETTIVFGTVVDNLTSEVMLIGRLGRFGSTPFLVGGR